MHYILASITYPSIPLNCLILQDKHRKKHRPNRSSQPRGSVPARWETQVWRDYWKSIKLNSGIIVGSRHVCVFRVQPLGHEDVQSQQQVRVQWTVVSIKVSIQVSIVLLHTYTYVHVLSCMSISGYTYNVFSIWNVLCMYAFVLAVTGRWGADCHIHVYYNFTDQST